MYKLMIFLHILGVILFFGNLIIAFSVMYRLKKTSSPQVLLHDIQTVNKADKWLTTISAMLILVSGIAAAIMAGIPIIGTNWILWSLIVWIASGFLFLIKVLPLQTKLEKTAAHLVSTTAEEQDLFQVYLGKWKVWSLLSSSLVVIAVVLMIFKPVI